MGEDLTSFNDIFLITYPQYDLQQYFVEEIVEITRQIKSLNRYPIYQEIITLLVI